MKLQYTPSAFTPGEKPLLEKLERALSENRHLPADASLKFTPVEEGEIRDHELMILEPAGEERRQKNKPQRMREYRGENPGYLVEDIIKWLEEEFRS